MFTFMSAFQGPVLAVAIWPDHRIDASPALLGFFASLFLSFTCLVIRGTRPASPAGYFAVVIGYAIGATIANTFVTRFYGGGVSALSSFVTALFAGAGVTVYLVLPVWPHFTAPHEPSSRVSAWMLLALPASVAPLAYLSEFRIIGTFLAASALMGFWIALFLMNIGLATSLSMNPRSAAAASFFFVLPEHLALNLLRDLWLLA